MVRVALFLAFLAVPLIEIYALIQVGQVIGAWWTILILVADSILGAWLLRRAWRGSWDALRKAMTAGRLPDRELADAALVIVGGTLLLTPGFVTDLVGFFFLLPVTRPFARRLLLSFVARRVQVRASSLFTGAAGFGRPGGLGGTRGGGAAGPEPMRPEGARATGSTRFRPGGARGGPVIQGEVVEDDTTPS